MIKRELETNIKEKFFQGKAIVLLGPRQTGKTTLVKKIITERPENTVWFTGDDYLTREELGKHSVGHLKSLIGDNTVVVIDEAQYVNNIGLTIKILVDNIPDLQVIATGSSSFELLNAVNESLTGRKWEYWLLPLGFRELRNHNGFIEERGLLEHRLVYGTYPEVVTCMGNEKEVLHLLSDSYLYKDIFRYDKLNKPKVLERLIRALAHQVSSEVSFNELARQIKADFQTVEKYIDLLEKTFVIFRLPSLNRNLRNEIKKSRKIYFYDNGVRNAIIGNFTPFPAREDKGALWENYFISERLKYLRYNRIYANCYFWRTHAQQEIDYVEEKDGVMHAFVIKWNPNKNIRFPATFRKAYPHHKMHGINPNNYYEFLD